jgi:hypothetical protein
MLMVGLGGIITFMFLYTHTQARQQALLIHHQLLLDSVVRGTLRIFQAMKFLVKKTFNKPACFKFLQHSSFLCSEQPGG